MADFRIDEMDLIVWRHADAGDAETNPATDLERRLTERGRKQADRMARWLHARLPERYAVISSPAVRARETANALGVKVRVDPRLAPDADVAHCIELLHWPEGAETRSRYVVLVGHQPMLGQLASMLLAGEPASWSIRKGAIWWFSTRLREGREQVVLRAAIAPDMT